MITQRSVLLLCAALLAACQSSSAPRTATHPSTTASPRATATAAAAGHSTQTAPAITVVDDRFGGDGRFTTPSGNIDCEIQDGLAMCSVQAHTWDAGPRDYPTECTAAQAHAGVQLDDTAHLRNDCYVLVERATVVLPYGHGLQVGRTRCVSEERGVTCLELVDGKGFTVSRTSVSLAPVPSALTRQSVPPSADQRDVTLPAGFHADFRTPSYNFVCELESALAHCLVSQHDWKVSPYQGECDADFSSEVQVRGAAKGEAFTECRSDALPGGEVLDYGHWVQVGNLRCTSARTGLTCRHGTAGHGFTASKARFRGY